MELHSFRPTLDGVSFESIPTEMCDWLERPFEEEEVFKALGEMCGDKAPGPDGFTIAFYKRCWRVVKDDFMKVLLEFHKDASLERSANATFIALIPKKGEAVDIRDFRPGG